MLSSFAEPTFPTWMSRGPGKCSCRCRPPRKTFGASRFWVSRLRASLFGFHSFGALLSHLRASLFDSHSSEPSALEPHISGSRSHPFESHSLSLTLTNLALSSRSLGLHPFEPYPVGSLHFFDPDPNAPDPRLRNIRPVTSVLGRVSKRVSRRTYKDNVSGMKLGCRAIERRQLGPENQKVRAR